MLKDVLSQAVAILYEGSGTALTLISLTSGLISLTHLDGTRSISDRCLTSFSKALSALEVAAAIP